MEIEARVSELSGWLPSLSFDFCYLLFNFASYWAFRLFEFSNGSWSVFCNFHLFEFSADNVYRLPLLLNFSIESITFLPEYQVCVAQYFCLITFSNYPNFLFILICGLCRVSGGFLKFRLLTNASHPYLVSNVFSVSSNCWMRSIFCHLFWVWIAWWLAVVKSRTLTKSR